jgi:hypothetical protein
LFEVLAKYLIAVPPIGRATQKREAAMLITENTEERRDEDALTVQQAARFLSCSSSKLNKSRVTDGGPVFVKDGRSVRYVRSA